MRICFESAALKCMLPWLMQHAEETRAAMGEDFWPYGFERNVHTLDTFLRYSFEQDSRSGNCRRRTCLRGDARVVQDLKPLLIVDTPFPICC